jgi:uncharacterized NAD-dependent epimerase/dehydratase family protein
MKKSAIVLTNGLYLTPNGKSAHGLVRYSSRFEIIAVVEPPLVGQDAGEALDGIHRGIPIVASIDDAMSLAESPPEFCVVGIATHGGHLSEELKPLVLEAVRKGMSIASGLHDAVSDVPEIAAAGTSCTSGRGRSIAYARHESRCSAPTARWESAPPPRCS